MAQDESRAESRSGENESGESSKEEEISIIVVENDGAEETVTVKYIFPEYLGALIVAEGAESATVKLAITQAVTSVTGLPIGNVTVLSMKK